MAGARNKQLFLLQEILDFEQINEKQTVALVHEANRVKSDSVVLGSVVMTACTQTLNERHVRMPNYYGDVCIMKSSMWKQNKTNASSVRVINDRVAVKSNNANTTLWK